MNINPVSNNTFSALTVIKSKDARLINFLNDIDFFILRNAPKKDVRFNAIATSTQTKGFWVGNLLTGKDAETICKLPDENSPEKVVSSLDDILKIEAFANIKDKVVSLYSKFNW